MKTCLSLLVIALLAVPVVAQDAQAPVKAWTGSLGAGLAVTSGNSDTSNLNFAFNTVWDPKTNRIFKAEAVVLRGETDGETQIDKSTALLRYERNVSSRAFWFVETPYLRDPFKDISWLVSPLAGGGLRLLDGPVHKLVVDGAAGAAFESSEALGSETSGALKAGQSYEWTISPNSRFTQRLTGLWKTNDFSDALYHLDVGLSATVATRVELKLSWIYDYANQPPSPDVEKGDSAMLATVLYKF